MPVTLLMYDKALARIGDRLRALGLDLDIATFDKSGQVTMGAKSMPPEEVSVDYVWLSSDMNIDGFQAGGFDLSLALRSAKVLQTFNAGLDHPFYKQLSAKGTRISNSSAQAVAISEYVMGQILAVFQPIEEQRRLQATRTWKITPYREIAGTSWLIVGYGPIGREIAKRAKVFGAQTSVIRRSPATSDLVDRAGTLADLPEFAPEADVVVLACPLNAETRGFAGATFFASLKPGSTLVNIARGALIDDAAMIASLDEGRLATAILDVFHEEPMPADNPLWSHPKVRLTSHTSFAGSGVRGRWDELFLENIARFARGQPLLNEFNPRDFP
ncbi:MAG: NAD(P)-dependent oxidoreductase [Hyphomicrobiaceae bacterium]